eukprot:1157982-Pelagomonas_calceolata.AAC.1
MCCSVAAVTSASPTARSVAGLLLLLLLLRRAVLLRPRKCWSGPEAASAAGVSIPKPRPATLPAAVGSLTNPVSPASAAVLP